MNKNLRNIGLIVLLKLLLETTYIFFVSTKFEYMGFYNDINFIKLIESYLITISIYLVLNKQENKISSIVIILLYFLMIIPTLSLYAMKNESRLFMYFFIASYLITLLVTRLPRLKLVKIRVSNYILFLVLAFVSLFTYSYLLVYNGLPKITALNLLNVYEVRDEFNYGPLKIMNYLIVWQAKVINPFIIGVSLYKRKYPLAAIGVFLQISLFLFTGHKSYLLSIILILAIIYGAQKKKIFIYSVLGLSAVAFFSFVLYLFSISDLYASIFIRRLLFIPAQNYFYYYDFFSKNEYMFLAHSVLSWLFKNRYDTPIPNLIGEIYYHNPNSWVNTGYLGDAFMNFGFIGLIVFSAILGFVLLIYDSISKNINIVVVISTSIISFQNLVDGGLLTTLLTGGLIVSMLILYLYSNTDKQNIEYIRVSLDYKNDL